MKSLVGSIVNKTPVPLVRRVAGLSGAFTAATMGGNREQQAAQYGANGTLHAIVSGIAADFAGIEWHLYSKAKSGRKEDRKEITSHAAIDRWEHPNDFMSGQEYREIVQQHLDLTGEGWTLFSMSPLADFPLELWPILPHRMTPVPHPEKFLAGYIYASPDGEQVPLDVKEVAPIRQPHPLDYLRGLGVVQAIGVDLETDSYARAWSRNFFLNSAEPGGIVEFPNRLGDDEWDEFNERWREQHQGVANAHRVATLEAGGKWVDRKYTNREMQFVELRGVSREAIRGAYRYPVAMMGESKDVNRAVAAAQKAIYAEGMLVPRVNRWRGWLNHKFLPRFGATAKGLEWDYDSPVPADADAENAERESKATSAKTYIDAGYSRRSVKEALDLPEALEEDERPTPVPVPPVPGQSPGVDPSAPGPDDGPGALGVLWWSPGKPDAPPPAGRHLVGGLYVWRPLNTAEETAQIDLDDVQADWETALGDLLAAWAALSAVQVAALLDQVRHAVQAGDPVALAGLKAPTSDAADAIHTAAADLAARAAARVAEEAARQGVHTEAGAVTDSLLREVSTATARMLGQALAGSAGREALRVYRPGRDGADQADAVADQVGAHLDGLSDARLREQLGGTLSLAQNLGRLATLGAAPPARYYASEILDSNTCKPCERIDEKELPSLDAALTAYGPGYLLCLGGVRCRGTFVAVWGDRARDDAPAPEKPAVPAEAKPFHRNLDGVEHLATTVADVQAADHAGTGVRWTKLGGGASAETRLAELPDGRRVVHKRAPEWGDPDAPRTQADAEQLASLMARALGVPAPGVYRTEGDAVWIDWAAGKTVGELDHDHMHHGRDEWQTRYAAMLEERQGKVMGLLDMLAGNPDRNPGNLIVDSGRLVGIDHGFAWGWANVEGHAMGLRDFGSIGGKPHDHFLELDPDGNPVWKDNPLTPADVKEVRARLKALRPDFRKVGRGDWLDWSLQVLDELAGHATGTEPLYG